MSKNRNDKRKSVLLLSDNISSTTGNSKVALTLLKGLQKQGYNVSSMSVGGDEPETEFDGIRLLPISQYGFDDNSVNIFMTKLTRYLLREKPDYFIVLGDRVHFQQLGIGNIEKEFIKQIDTKMIFWETVDSDVRLCMESMLNNPRNPKRDIYNTFDYIVTTSQYGKDVLENELIKVDKVIWEFVDTELFLPITDKKKLEIRKDYRFKHDDFIFMVVGRCIRRKNHELVIEALYPFLIDNPKVRLFCMIPDYNSKDDLNLIDFCKRVLPIRYGGRDMIDEQKILFCTSNGKPLNIVAGIDQEEVIKFYQASDAVISGSMNEGFNLVVCETISTGLPYIGINNTTIPELTNNGEVGFIAPASQEQHVGLGIKLQSTSIENMREQIKKVLALSVDERKKISERYHKYADDHFSRSKMITEWVKYLQSIDTKKSKVN